jgi:excisionase family DNA binding protein
MTSPRASFSADEVAAMHNISASKIRKLVAAGELAKVPHLGRTIRIPYSEVVAKFGPVPDHVLEHLGGAA